MLNAVKIAFALSLCLLMFSSCDKDKNYPDTPFLEFRELRSINSTGLDSVEVACYFRDGNGDIGSSSIDCPLGWDIRGYFQVLDNGVWVEAENPPLLEWCVRSQTPDGQDKTLEGELYYATTAEQDPNGTNPSDTVRYGMQLQDRGGNLSNIVYSDFRVLD